MRPEAEPVQSEWARRLAYGFDVFCVATGLRVPPTAGQDTWQPFEPPAQSVVAPPEPPPSSVGLASHRQHQRRVRRIRSAVGISIALAVGPLAVLSFTESGLQFFEVPSPSMSPTLRVGDRILARKAGLDRQHMHIGDIVVFKRPATDRVDTNIADVVKRIVALPGQRVSSSGGVLLVNGTAVVQTYLPKGTATTNVTPEVIPKGDYFVMGDNRPDSYDSRYFGPIEATSIVGKVVAQVWPPGAFHIF